jgi:hypothetical protein
MNSYEVLDAIRTIAWAPGNGACIVATKAGQQIAIFAFDTVGPKGYGAPLAGGDSLWIELAQVAEIIGPAGEGAEVVARHRANAKAASARLEAELEAIDPEHAKLKKLQPGEVAEFGYSGTAYDRCQTSIEAQGVVLDCGEVIGLSHCWPVAITAEAGALHGVEDGALIGEEFQPAAVHAALALARSKALAIAPVFLAWEAQNPA